MPRSVGRLPADDCTNGWSALLPARTPRAPLQENLTVDWLVVGGGYAGIAAARQLARQQPTASIALMEAGVIGENASGRNSGFAIDLPHAPGSSPDLMEQGRRAIHVGRFALDELNSLVQEHGIECDWEQRGRYHVAVTPNVAVQSLKTYIHNLEAWNEPYQWLSRADLRERLGTDYYYAGIYTPGTYLMNPAALVRGLADSLPSQVRLFENSPVIEAQLNGEAPYVRSAQGSIRAGKAILAVNAFSQSFGVYRDCQIPVLLFASLSPVLSDSQIASLGSDVTWGLTPAHGVAGSTLRLTRDRRLMIRQGFEYSPELRTSERRRAKAKAMSQKLLRRRFPQLGAIELEHFWMGWLAVSHNHAPAFGQIAKNAYAVSCCNGSGIVRHTAAGMLIADFALGQNNPLIDDFLAQGKANYIPPRPLRDIGVSLALAWAVWRGRAEQ
ncbi:FAD-binding oxidoreductase [Vandammella animalimorsus]|uniref:FAD-dependent oxidoreductase n=1 Tax=Vandammella animalimorsus TaxID=2029117 RepID=A0A2A2AZJ2_9BURK|nr:FAD-binding oxidoreductase [Vandammella animalimorsus]PAT43158.1 FAD-dependent oxidoreductase [Vandammella animalimorsus]